MTTIGTKLASIRKQKGLTQEEVAESAKINLRTLQRIEKDETDPRGNTLNNICTTLGIAIEDILDYGKAEDNSYLMFLHLSVLTGIVIPFGNIILPLILWLNKRDRIVQVQQQGANILNYQIVWTVVTNVLLVCYVIFKITHAPYFNAFMYALIGLYILNFIMPIVCAIRVRKGNSKNFYPAPLKIIR